MSDGDGDFDIGCLLIIPFWLFVGWALREIVLGLLKAYAWAVT